MFLGLGSSWFDFEGVCSSKLRGRHGFRGFSWFSGISVVYHVYCVDVLCWEGGEGGGG